MRTRSWIKDVVIGHNFCPFAKPVYNENLIKYFVSAARSEEEVIIDLCFELTELVQVSPRLVETTVMIIPHVLQDFNSYNNFLKVVDEVLEVLDFTTDIQVASFHPQYQFAKTDVNDPTNLTNQSPYPILHLLRVSSLTKAIESHPNPENIFRQNIKKIREMSALQLKVLQKSIHRK